MLADGAGGPGAVTESQNHRIAGVGRDLCGSPSPTLLPKQGHPQQVAQDLVQAGLEYLQRRRLHCLPGQPVPVLHHPQREYAPFSYQLSGQGLVFRLSIVSTSFPHRLLIFSRVSSAHTQSTARASAAAAAPRSRAPPRGSVGRLSQVTPA